MSSLMDSLSQQIGPEQLKHLSSQLGATPEQTENAIGMALPTLLGAMARKADDDGEIAKLHGAIDAHDDDALGGISGLLGGNSSTSPDSAQALLGSGGNILESILGGRKSKVESGIGKASGLSSGQIGSLMSMLAPLVLGTIGKKARSGGLDMGGLAGMLRGEKKEIEQQASGGLLSGLLDQDGDGDFDFSDVMKLGMSRLFGK